MRSDAFFGEFMKKGYFTVFEKCLWCTSVAVILLTFFIFDGSEYLSMIASLVGVTALIFCAKGNPVGQMMMIAFGLIYGYISFGFRYYGEMATYLGMTVPMAVLSLISWLRNPFKKGESEVKVNSVKGRELALLFVIAAIVTAAFYFILDWLGTANLLTSTLSVTTSFIAAYLTVRRSPAYALAYALNDLVLIVLWILATGVDSSYFSVIICFVIFLINDLYGFFNWTRMKKRQQKGSVIK